MSSSELHKTGKKDFGVNTELRGVSTGGSGTFPIISIKFLPVLQFEQKYVRV